jgi:hypothetical protein
MKLDYYTLQLLKSKFFFKKTPAQTARREDRMGNE